MLLLGGCGGGGAAPTPTPSPSPVPASTAAGGTGLIADVDIAVVAAVCTDMKEASQLAGTGLADDQLRLAVNDAITQLNKPPHPAAALRLAAVLGRDVRRHRLDAAVNAGVAWCAEQGR